MGNPTRYLLGGAGLYVGVATAAYIRVKSNQCPEVCEHAKTTDGQAFNALADTYDQQVGWDEKLMGITLLRWMLLRQAKVIKLMYGPSKMLISKMSACCHCDTWRLQGTPKGACTHLRNLHAGRYFGSLCWDRQKPFLLQPPASQLSHYDRYQQEHALACKTKA